MVVVLRDVGVLILISSPKCEANTGFNVTKTPMRELAPRKK
jgi:hypothetical protein